MKDDKNTENVEKKTANKIHCGFKAFFASQLSWLRCEQTINTLLHKKGQHSIMLLQMMKEREIESERKRERDGEREFDLYSCW